MGHRPIAAVNLATIMSPKISLAAALAVVVLLASACGNLLDPAAAVVDGVKITTQRIDEELERFERMPQYDELVETAQQGPDDPDVQVGQMRRQFEQALLSQLIRRRIIRPLAAEEGIEVTDADVDAAFEDLLTQLEPANIDDPEERRAAAEAELGEQMGGRGLTMQSLREILRDQQIEQQLREKVSQSVSIDEEEARAFYEENIQDYTESRAAHILVSDEQLAQRLSNQLRSAPPDRVDALFARLAREHSEDTGSGKAGGDLGYAPAGTYVAPFENTLASLEEGEISDPVQTQFGYHVLRLIDTRTTPFEEAAVQILDQLLLEAQEEAWLGFIRDAYRDADIRVNPRYGRLDLQTQRVVDAGGGDIPGTVEPAPSATAPEVVPQDSGG